MSNLLMYGESREQGWQKGNFCNYNSVKDVDKTNKKTCAEEPKVSIPSPFARFELVQKAFENYVKLGPGETDYRDVVLISHTLDLIELFYENPSQFSCLQWSKASSIRELKSSESRGHNLFGCALELYSTQENYGFEDSDTTITIIKYDSDVIGCTSPTSLMLPTPRFYKFNNIKIEGSYLLFGQDRMLFARDRDFIEYLFRQTSVFIDKLPMNSFCEYLKKMKDIIRTKNVELYRKIADFPVATLADKLPDLYDINNEVSLYGVPLYHRKKTSAVQQIVNNSDFILQGAKGGKQPMVLTNNCVFPNLSYTTRNEFWSKKLHAINYDKTVNEEVKKKYHDGVVPGTSVVYEWMCENDFLSDIIVKVPYQMSKYFFSSNDEDDSFEYSFFPPLKPKFFEYLDISYLYKENGGRKNYSLNVKKRGDEISEVTVSLILQIKGGKPLEFKKTYLAADDNSLVLSSASGVCCKDASRAIGYIFDCPVALSIFPFAKLKSKNCYRLMSAIGTSAELQDFKFYLSAVKSTADGTDVVLEWSNDIFNRTNNTKYFSLENDFDYLQLKFSDDGKRAHYAICVPLWPKEHSGTKKLNFAFDFGTTNSYIAVRDEEAKKFLDFKLDKSVACTIGNAPASDLDNVLMQLWRRQEFLPDKIGEDYKFPLRTVILKPASFNLSYNTPQCLQHVNIPFIYCKEDYNQSQNDPRPNLKWSNKAIKTKSTLLI